MTESFEPITTKVALYARVSTANQEEQHTIETQLSAAREYASLNNLEIVQEYRDDGWSGQNLARPALDQLREDAGSDARLWTAILVYDPDRVSRVFHHMQVVLEDFKEKGVDVFFVTTPRPKTEEEEMMLMFKGVFAQYERSKINERFRLGKLRKIKEGKLLVSRSLYGYELTKKKGNESGFYTINEEEAEVVRKMFAWVADEGLTIRKIVRRLEKEGIKPRFSSRGVWNTSTLTTLLRNEAYIGKAHWYSSTAVAPKNPISKAKYRKIKKSSRVARPKSEWMTVPVPVIVKEELFLRARARLTENAQLNKRSKKYPYLLAQRIVCVCGKRRTGAGRVKGKYLYYECPDKIYCFPLKRSCYENPINAKIADELVWNKLSSLMSSSDLLEKQVEKWVMKKRGKKSSSIEELDSLTRRISKLKREDERYTRAYGKEVMSLEEWQHYVKPIREQIQQIQERLDKARQFNQEASTNEPLSKKEIQSMAERACAALFNLSFEQKRAIVLNTVEEIVGTQKQLVVHGNIPVSNTFYGGFKTSNRYRRSPKRRQIDAF